MRESGYYWVKIHKNYTIGYFNSKTNDWLIVGSDELFKNEDFEFIGKIICPEVDF